MKSLVLLGALWLSLPQAICAAQTAGNSTSPTAAPTLKAQEFHFAGLQWGSGPDVVKAALASQGLAYVAADSVGDLSFSGQIIGRNATALAWMSQGRLVRLDVRFAPAPHTALPIYREVRYALLDKYGPPSKSTETFDPPYAFGDGKEDEALAKEKGHFIAMWGASGGNIGQSLLLFIDTRPAVVLLYASPEWNAEEQRRK